MCLPDDVWNRRQSYIREGFSPTFRVSHDDRAVESRMNKDKMGD